MFSEKTIDNIIVNPVKKFKINVFNITMDNVKNNLEYHFKNENELTKYFLYLHPKYFKQIKIFPDSDFEKLCHTLIFFQNTIKIKAMDLKELLYFMKIWPKLRHSSFYKIKNLLDDMEESYSNEGEKEEHSDIEYQCYDHSDIDL